LKGDPKPFFADKRSYQEAEMDIKSAVDNAEYMGENGRGDGSPKFKNNNN
jgi:hypothetical protein